MKPRRPLVSPEEQALFLAAIDGARPLETRDRVPVPAPVPSIVKVAALPSEVKLVVEGDGRRYTARAPGVSHAQVAELRAGRLRAEDTLDLHGETVDAGIAKLREFFARANRTARRCVLIIHGKGTHSDHGAPLREAVLAEMLGALSGFVHAFSTASPADGGEGATYVMLTRSTR
jgi:DNA-nicking Smr family endonuclease